MAAPPAISPTIKDQVYAILKAEICSGVHKDGQRLHENELATRLNVSRSPVREALRQLASDGLVLELPNKGVFVKELTPEDIENIFEVRLLLENYAIRRSPGFLTETAVEEYNRFRDRLEKLHAAGDIAGYTEIDGQIHNLIVQLSGNSVAMFVYSKISSLAEKFRAISLLGKQRFDESVDEHLGIIGHILNRETEQAAALNERHLDRAKREIIEYLSSRDTPE